MLKDRIHIRSHKPIPNWKKKNPVNTRKKHNQKSSQPSSGLTSFPTGEWLQEFLAWGSEGLGEKGVGWGEVGDNNETQKGQTGGCAIEEWEWCPRTLTATGPTIELGFHWGIDWGGQVGSSSVAWKDVCSIMLVSYSIKLEVEKLFLTGTLMCA